MQIKIGNETYEPVYNFGTLRRIGELTKKDPFTLNIDYTKPDEVYRYVQIIVHAGLMSAKAKVNQEQVQEAIDNWSLTQAMEVIQEFNQSFVVEPKPGDNVSAQ